MAWPMRKTREGWGHALVELGTRDPNVVVLVGDLAESTMVHFFAQAFPDRFFQCNADTPAEGQTRPRPEHRTPAERRTASVRVRL